MDPLSLIASLIAVGQGARAGLDTIRKIKAVWNAPAEIEEINSKLRELDETLDEILCFISDTGTASFGKSLSPPVARAKETVFRVNELLDSQSLDRLHKSKTSSARVKFLRHGNEVKSLINDLQIVRMDLCVHLGLITAFVSPFHFSAES